MRKPMKDGVVLNLHRSAYAMAREPLRMPLHVLDSIESASRLHDSTANQESAQRHIGVQVASRTALPVKNLRRDALVCCGGMRLLSCHSCSGFASIEQQPARPQVNNQ
jgi:hypothetical protein